MAPNTDSLRSSEIEEMAEASKKLVTPKINQIVYRNIITFSLAHAAALYGLYLGYTRAMWPTIVFNGIIYVLTGIGVTAGAHRLWSHRSYKAKMPLQIILMVLNSLAFQDSAISWIRNHRMHHKYTDTDADPCNTRRGYFFAHIGWLLVKKHPEILRRGKSLDMSDVYANPVLMFQKKYALPVFGGICFLFPTLVPIYFWGETLNNAWHINMFRYLMNLNISLMVNSVAHSFGTKAYDKSISATQNVYASMSTLGEGFHNFHHVFPWDYRSAELGNNWCNMTTWFIDFMAWVGWAYDLKAVSPEVVKTRAARTGDGTNEWGYRVNDDD